MTYSVIPALRKQPELAAEWEPRFTSLGYDGAQLRPAADKPGALCGMGMTEKQGGSDVRANTTVAAPLNGGGPGAEYELTGHKWFMSAPMCDAFLVLAQADGGLSCFLLPALHARRRAQPRSTSSGSRTSSATARTPPARSSSAAPGRGWSARRARGVPTIIEMVNHTRLDCCLGAAAGMRAGVAAGDPPHLAALGLRQAADRPAADAKRARRPRDRVRGGDDRRDAPRPRLRRVDRRRRGRDPVQADRQRGAQVLALQAAPSRTPARRSSASAATATSRSRGCRASTASRR